jgi:predicted N-acetyltransferase YhbS
VGEELVRACIERARGDGRGRLVLHSTPSMTTAHRLYERLGFRRAPGRDFAPVPAVPLLGFELDLRPGGQSSQRA